MSWFTVGMVVVGLMVLTLGAEFLIRGSARLAAALGVSPLVIGLTIVAYGTSTPELVVSIQSGWEGQDDVAIANAVGSNLFNILAILGPCALILPLNVSKRLIRVDVPIMIGSCALAFVLSLDGRIGKWDGILLTGLIIAYTAVSLIKGRKESSDVEKEFEAEFGAPSSERSPLKMLINLGLIGIGLVCLIFGGRWFVDGSIELARFLGVSEMIIGLTIVAAGTSMPELATSLVATLRGERDIAIGNVVGSNIYNMLCILGIASLITPEGLSVNPIMLRIDFPFMVLVCVACLPIFWTGMKISRVEGGALLACYIAYTLYLIWTQSAELPATASALPLGPTPLRG